MFSVKNKKIIGKLSRRSLKQNRLRNLIAIAAIVLTTAMFTTLFTIGASVVESFQESTMRQVGTSSHGGFKFLTWQQYEKVAADAKVQDISYNVIIGTPTNPAFQKTPAELRWTEEKSAKWGFCSPVVGTLPKNRLDIATTTEVLDALGVPCELGAKVPLEFTANGETYREEFTLCGWWENDVILRVNEIFLSREYGEEVAPTWQDGQPTYNKTDFSGAVNASLWFSSAWDIEKQMAELKERCGFGPEVNDGVNWAYVSDAVDPATAALIAGMLLVITLSGYLIIYNIFYISINGEIRFYGLLKTIGATNQQLKRMVRRQAFLLSGVGVPLGLTAGYGLSVLLVPTIVRNMTSAGMYKISASPLIFLGSAVFSLFTVWISCIRPCRLVCRISPVEAVRYHTDAGIRKRRKHAKRVTALSMALGNIGRMKKKTAAVVLSLSLSLILLNITVSLARGFDMDKYLQDRIVSDFIVSDASVLNNMTAARVFNSITPEIRSDLERLPGVTKSGCVYMQEYNYQLNDKDLLRGLSFLEETEEETAADPVRNQVAESYLAQRMLPSHIYGTDGLAEENLEIFEGKFDRTKFESGDYVIVSSFLRNMVECDHFYNVGDRVTLDTGEGPKEYEILALGNIPFALGPQHGHGFDIYFTLPAKEFRSLTGETGAMNLALDVEDGRVAGITDQIQSYCENVNSGLDYRSRQTYADEFQQMQSTYTLVGGALSLILALIGILNFVNAVVTSIQSRRQELAVLQSIGMTGKQLRRTLMGEGVCFIALTALFALTLGSAAAWGVMCGVENIMWYFSYRFTITPVLLAALALLPLSALIPAVCSALMCRTSIVDRLREGEP